VLIAAVVTASDGIDLQQMRSEQGVGKILSGDDQVGFVPLTLAEKHELCEHLGAPDSLKSQVWALPTPGCITMADAMVEHQARFVSLPTVEKDVLFALCVGYELGLVSRTVEELHGTLSDVYERRDGFHLGDVLDNLEHERRRS